MQTIIETAIANPDFSTLVSALKTAELVDALSGTGPLTVFAPTNAAFAKIPEATLQSVLADNMKLTALLKNHVIPAKVLSTDTKTMSETKTLGGTNLKISSDKGITVNDAKVTLADIDCSNGVIHVIDTVLLP